MKNFNKKAHYPFTYGDENADEGMFSDYVVELMKNKRFQSHMTSVFFALVMLGISAQPSSVIPTEYGEAANEMLNQVAQNDAAGGVPAVPLIDQIQGQVPVAQENIIRAMPLDQQRLITAQQPGRAMPGVAIGEIGPTNPPSFYIPDKPRLIGYRVVNTVAFTTALGVICLNAAWGEPVAILMCSSGLMGIAYKLGKKVVIFMSKNIN